MNTGALRRWKAERQKLPSKNLSVYHSFQGSNISRGRNRRPVQILYVLGPVKTLAECVSICAHGHARVPSQSSWLVSSSTQIPCELKHPKCWLWPSQRQWILFSVTQGKVFLIPSCFLGSFNWNYQRTNLWSSACKAPMTSSHWLYILNLH